MARIRLNRYLALSGIASRRKCEQIIGDGRVSVNGEIIRTPALIVDTTRDRVTCDDEPVEPDARRQYVMLNKPLGVLSTVSDPQGRATVADYFPPGAGRIYPVGRLDADTTGLVLLTDDGKLAFRVMHPRYTLPKRYLALVEGHVRRRALARLREGVDLDGRPAVALAASLTVSDGKQSVLRVTLGEGRKRQVRRMCEIVGHRVLALHRETIGPLHLGDLAVGETRDLNIFEVRRLRRAVALGDV